MEQCGRLFKVTLLDPGGPKALGLTGGHRSYTHLDRQSATMPEAAGRGLR